MLPVSAYFDTRTSRMDTDVYFKNSDLKPYNFRKIILSENNSDLLTIGGGNVEQDGDYRREWEIRTDWDGSIINIIHCDRGYGSLQSACPGQR